MGIEILKVILILLLIVCAICVNLTGNLLRSVIIFMSYSSIMCLVWLLLESPDLAITEAAVGAGVSGILFLMTLKKIDAEDAGDDVLRGRDDDWEVDYEETEAGREEALSAGEGGEATYGSR